MLERAHRPPGARRAADDQRPLARRRGLPRPRQPHSSDGRRAHGTAPGTCCGSRWSGCRGSATSPTSTRWRPNRGWSSATPPPGRARRRRPGHPARHPGHRGRPGLAARAAGWPPRSPTGPRRAGRCSASAAATRCWPARSTTRWRAGPAPSPASGCCRPASASADRRCWAAAGEAFGEPVTGYEIHHGRGRAVRRRRAVSWRLPAGAVCGTSWHGLLENDGFRRAFLAAAAPAGRPFMSRAGHRFPAARGPLDALGDLIARAPRHRRAARLIERGVPAGFRSSRRARQKQAAVSPARAAAVRPEGGAW